MTFAVGLTGGIASGKSLVASLFSARGADVVDADQVARDVVAIGTPGLARLVEHFGPQILDKDGSLARRRMRETVFADASQRQALEAILHPLIHAELARRKNLTTSAYAILMIPLLARTPMRKLVDRILVVDAPELVQLERLKARDGITSDLANAMLAAQESREQRLAIADDVLVNTGLIEDLAAPVAELHARYLALAQTTASGRQAAP